MTRLASVCLYILNIRTKVIVKKLINKLTLYSREAKYEAFRKNAFSSDEAKEEEAK